MSKDWSVPLAFLLGAIIGGGYVHVSVTPSLHKCWGDLEEIYNAVQQLKDLDDNPAQDGP